MTTTKRQAALMGVLLLVLAVSFGRPLWAAAGGAAPASADAPLPGPNAISDVVVTREGPEWIATVRYVHTGEPAHAHLVVLPSDAARPADVLAHPRLAAAARVPVLRGAHEVRIPVQHPGSPAPTTATAVDVAMLANGQALASRRLDVVVRWPDFVTYLQESAEARKTPAQRLEEAVAKIDAGNSHDLGLAKGMLERLLLKDPRMVGAYVEMARVAMRSNWGPEGLRQAEDHLKTAGQLDPADANVKILLGYVHAHQGRHASAEALFEQAARTSPPNLWLWANWGEVLAMQGRPAAAVAKYRVAVAGTRSGTRNDRARLDAFEKLIALLKDAKDWDAVEALYTQRTAEYHASECDIVGHAWFLLDRRGDVVRAMALARDGLDSPCGADAAREVLGAASYLAWQGADAADKPAHLGQARVFLPAGPRAWFVLARSDRTAAVLKPLVAGGNSLEDRDNLGLTALALALQSRDAEAAGRLLRAGAKATATVGNRNVPVALVPVFQADVASIRVLQRAGVNFGALKFEGQSALDIARQVGEPRVLNALQGGQGVL